jgi:hypothetical protein
MQSVQLNVADECKNLGDAIAAVIKQAKVPGSTLIQDAEAALPPLLAAAASIANIGADIKLPENQAYIIYAVLGALEPQASPPVPPAPTPAA